VALGDEETVRPELIRYVNRLSDTVYALARLEESCEELCAGIRAETLSGIKGDVFAASEALAALKER